MSVEAVTPDEAVRPRHLSLGGIRVRSIMAAQEAALFAWIPVFLAIGIWTYFAWAEEPSLLLIAALGFLALALAILWSRCRHPFVLGLCLVLAGTTLAKIRTEWVRAPVLPATTGEITCEGAVLAVEARRGNRVSLTIGVSSLSGVSSSKTPSAIRLLAPHAPAIEIGDLIKTRCRLFPPPAPVSPGGFDYARTLWFEGIGATGRVVGAVEIVGHATSLAGSFQAWLQSLRTNIGERIRGELKGDIGAIGEALITGERAEISREANTNLQAHCAGRARNETMDGNAQRAARPRQG